VGKGKNRKEKKNTVDNRKKAKARQQKLIGRVWARRANRKTRSESELSVVKRPQKVVNFAETWRLWILWPSQVQISLYRWFSGCPLCIEISISFVHVHLWWSYWSSRDAANQSLRGTVR
jgi:hypothetical protein